MSFQVVKFDESKFERWNKFIDKSINGTIFHRLDFLQYHGEKFANEEHHLLILKGSELVAVMPMAVFLENGVKVARSPYGGSFGGLVVQRFFGLSDVVSIFSAIKEYLADLKMQRLYITNGPSIYNDVNDESLTFGLLCIGAQLHETDLFNVVALPQNSELLWSSLQGRARTAIRKSKEDFTLFENVSVEDYYPILLEDKERLGAKPTHTEDELTYLKETFPELLMMDIAQHNETGARAANCYFNNKKDVHSSFYMSQENAALRLNGTNILVYHAMERAVLNGCKWFDFGGSTFGFKVDNPGVAKFKESFGAIGVLRSKFVLDLDK